MPCCNCRSLLQFLNSPSITVPSQLQSNKSIAIVMYSLVVNLLSATIAYILTVVNILDYDYYVLIILPFIIGFVFGLVMLLRKYPHCNRYAGFSLLFVATVYNVESHFFQEKTLMGYSISNLAVMVINNMLLIDFVPKFYLGFLYNLIHCAYMIARWTWRPDFDLVEFSRFVCYVTTYALYIELLYYFMFVGKYSFINSYIKEAKTKESWANTMESMKIPLIISDSHYSVVFANESSQELGIAQGKNEQFIRKLLDEQNQPLQYYTHNNKNYSIKAQKVYFNGCDCHLFIFQDITEVIQKEEKKFINILIATITHELRSPLNIISTILKMLNPYDQQDLISKALSACMIQESLINDILDLSKIENGKFNITPHPCNMLQCTKEVVDLFRLQTNSTKLAIALTESSPVPCELNVDEKRYKQILINLLSNAIKFTTKGSVKVSISYSLPMWQCKIEDSGIGIKKEDFSKIFTRFGMASSNMALNSSGSGIGLNLVKQICELMGGAISFTSAYQIGSVFQFYIKADPIEQINLSISDISKSMVSHKEVVIIDDNQMNLFAAEKLFDRLKAKHKEFQDPKEGLSYILHHVSNIRIAFIDLNMPNMSGYEVASALKNSGLYLVCLSGEDSEHVEDECKKFGFNLVMEKPISLSKVEALLNNHL